METTCRKKDKITMNIKLFWVLLALLSGLGTTASAKGLSTQQRLVREINSLRHEIQSPTPTREGGMIAGTCSSLVQSALIVAMSEDAAHDTTLLRQQRDMLTGPHDPVLRDRLTVALGLTGVQDTIPGLLRIARTDPFVGARTAALEALAAFAKPASRGHPAPALQETAG